MVAAIGTAAGGGGEAAVKGDGGTEGGEGRLRTHAVPIGGSVFHSLEVPSASLHEGNFARYRLRPAEFGAWQKTWR
jgi:hypothetical protein